MKRKDPASVGDIIKELIRESGVDAEYNAQRLCYLWPEVVGPTVNRYTSRRWVEGRTLHVGITSAALRNELSFQRQTLVEHLNKAAGTDVIDSIMFH